MLGKTMKYIVKSNNIYNVSQVIQSQLSSVVTSKKKRGWSLHLLLFLFLLGLSACGENATVPVPSRPQSPDEAISNMLNSLLKLAGDSKCKRGVLFHGDCLEVMAGVEGWDFRADANRQTAGVEAP